jgi:hypothetical protein
MIPYDLIVFCLKKSPNLKILLIYIGSFFFFMISNYFYLFKLKSNCSGWIKGLNNTSLENDVTKHGCQIKIPKKCTFKILKYIQDFTKIRGKDCETYNNKKFKEILLKNSNSSFVRKTSLRIGFPLTNKDPICFKDFSEDDNAIYKYVLDNLVDMDDESILEKYFKDKIPEIEIDFSDNSKGKLNVKVKYNKTLSDERKLLESNSEPYSNNI